MKHRLTELPSVPMVPEARDGIRGRIPPGSRNHLPIAGKCDVSRTPVGQRRSGRLPGAHLPYPDTVVASALWHFEPTLDKAIAEVRNGTFKADDYGVYSFMKNGGCSLAPLGTFDSKVPDDIKAKVAEKEKMIKDGVFTVEINDAEPKSS